MSTPSAESDSSNIGATFHDGLADGWSAGYARRGFQKRGLLFKSILQTLVRKGDRWLDAGCGSGFLSRQLCALGADVIGVDASAKMIDVAKAETGATHEGASFLTIETIENIPFPDGYFEGVLCSSVVEYLDDPTKAIREMTRVTKPGGVLLVSVPNRQSLIRHGQRIVRRAGALLQQELFRYLTASKREYSSKEFIRLIQDAGLEVNAVRFFDPVLPSLVGLRSFSALLIIACQKSPSADHRLTMPDGPYA